MLAGAEGEFVARGVAWDDGGDVEGKGVKFCRSADEDDEDDEGDEGDDGDEVGSDGEGVV